MTPVDNEVSVGLGVLALILQVFSMLKSTSSCPKLIECSGLLNGSQTYKLMESGVIVGGDFKTRGSMFEAQEDWTAVITMHELTIESPISRYDTTCKNTLQWAAPSPLTKDLSAQPSWLWMMIATTIDSDQMRQSCATIESCSFQNNEVMALVQKRYELIR